MTAQAAQMLRERRPIVERFWPKVDKRGPDECWPWKASLDSGGYGQISLGGRERPTHAHRVSYELAFGPIPDGMYICHRCDNRICVNPTHLFAGTPTDNVRDMMSKRRARFCPKGARRRACLTLEQVAAVRDAEGTQAEIAARFGIHQTHVSRIKLGKLKTNP